MIAALLLSLPLLFGTPALADEVEDPYLWLEDVTGEGALDRGWVRWRRQQRPARVRSAMGCAFLWRELAGAVEDELPEEEAE